MCRLEKVSERPINCAIIKLLKFHKFRRKVSRFVSCNCNKNKAPNQFSRMVWSIKFLFYVRTCSGTKLLNKFWFYLPSPLSYTNNDKWRVGTSIPRNMFLNKLLQWLQRATEAEKNSQLQWLQEHLLVNSI